MNGLEVVSEREWEAAWDALPVKEKEHARALDVFLRDGDDVHRTYLTTGRGVERLGSVWTFLDPTPLGRQETWEDTPEGRPRTEPYEWWRLHDEYAGHEA